MTHLKGDGHRIYIQKPPRYMDLPMKSPNVIFSQKPRIRPCRAIPLEQLTIGICGRKSSKGMELRLLLTPLQLLRRISKPLMMRRYWDPARTVQEHHRANRSLHPPQLFCLDLSPPQFQHRLHHWRLFLLIQAVSLLTEALVQPVPVYLVWLWLICGSQGPHPPQFHPKLSRMVTT